MMVRVDFLFVVVVCCCVHCSAFRFVFRLCLLFAQSYAVTHTRRCASPRNLIVLLVFDQVHCLHCGIVLRLCNHRKGYNPHKWLCFFHSSSRIQLLCCLLCCSFSCLSLCLSTLCLCQFVIDLLKV